MPYTQQASRLRPGCVLFLVDQSASMADVSPQLGYEKAEVVANWVNHELEAIAQRGRSGEEIRDWCYAGVIGYGETVKSAFLGTLAGRYLVSTTELARSPARFEERETQELDEEGNIVDVPVQFPVWIEPEASGSTPTVRAFEMAAEVLSEWAARNPSSFPPIVVNVTDGEPTDGDPVPAISRLRSISTEDGNVLVFNAYLASAPATPVEWASREQDVPAGYPRSLFSASSPLPETLLEWLQHWGKDIPRGARGFNVDVRISLNWLFGGEDLPLARLHERTLGRDQGAPSGDPLRVFLCHASEDKPSVRSLYRWLNSIVVDPWLDEEDLIGGAEWEEEIPKAVRASDVVLVCVSKHVNKVGFLQKEIRMVLDVAEEQPPGAIFVVPLRLEECEMHARLRKWQWIDVYRTGGYYRLLRSLQRRARDLDKLAPDLGASADSSFPMKDPRYSGAASRRSAVQCIERGVYVGQIASIGGRNHDGTTWRLTEVEAIRAIEQGTWGFYVITPDERVIDLAVASEDGRKYLTTQVDRDPPGYALTNLPECG